MPCGCNNTDICACYITVGDGLLLSGNGLPLDPWLIEVDGGGGVASAVVLQGNPADVAPTCENRLRYNTDDELTFLPDGVEYLPSTALTLTSVGIDVPVGNSGVVPYGYQQTFTNYSDCDLYVTVLNNVDVTLIPEQFGSGAPPMIYTGQVYAAITNAVNEIGGLSEWPFTHIHLYLDPETTETIVPDTAFSTDGIATFTTWAAGYPWNVVIDASGRILASVRNTGSIGTAQGVARLTVAGALDATWAGDGFFDTTQGNGDLIIDSSARVLSLGALGSAEFRRYLANGTLDATFGVAGVRSVSIVAESFHGDVLLQQSDGYYLGFGRNGGSTSLLGARLDTAGTLDATYGTAGKINIVTSTSPDNVRGVLQSDDKPVIKTTNQALVRLDTLGALDATYGTGGVLDISPEFSNAQNLSIDQNDSVVVAGTFSSAARLARYGIGSGALDTTFGGTGIIDGFFSIANTDARAVGHLSSGHIVVAADSSSTNGVLIAVLTDSGSLDDSFFGTGTVDVSIGDTGRPTVTDLHVVGNGEIVVAGQMSSGTESFFIRLTPTDGAGDISVSNSGALESTFLLPAGGSETYTLYINTEFMQNSTGLVVDNNSLTHSAHVKYEPVRVGGFDVTVT